MKLQKCEIFKAKVKLGKYVNAGTGGLAQSHRQDPRGDEGSLVFSCLAGCPWWNHSWSKMFRFPKCRLGSVPEITKQVQFHGSSITTFNQISYI